MKKRSLMPITIVLLFCVFLLIRLALYDSSITRTSGWALIDMISFVMVFGPALGLYNGAFHSGGKGNPKLQQYQLRWIAEVFVITGAFAVVTSMIFMGSGIMGSVEENDLTTIIGSGLAATFIGAVYATLGVLSCYVIAMFLSKPRVPISLQVTAQLIDDTIPANGLNTKSLIGLFIAGVFVSLNLWMMSAMFEINFLSIIISYRAAILIGVFIITMSVLHTPGTLLRVFAIPIWRDTGWDSNISESLRLIHNAIRLLGLYVIIVTITTPVFILKNVADVTVLGALMQPSIYVFWLIILILYIYLIEGQLVQRHYSQTGEILAEGRKGRSLLMGIGFLVYGFSIGMAFMFVFLGMV